MIIPREKIRIFIDMDGTIAEWRNINLDLSTEEESDPKKVAEKLYQILTTEGYYITLKTYQNVIDGIRELMKSDQYEFFVASCYLDDTGDCSPLSEKNKWLDEELPEIGKSHRIFIPNGEDKTKYVPGGIRSTDVLLDDYTKNLKEWEAAGGIGIKVLNGLNATKGTWQGARIQNSLSGREFAENLKIALKLINHEKELTDINQESEKERE